MQDFGRALFDALMSGDVRSRYDVSQTRMGKGLRLKLRVQPPAGRAALGVSVRDPRGEYVCLSPTPHRALPGVASAIQPLDVPPLCGFWG